jgi:hypothetical protein
MRRAGLGPAGGGTIFGLELDLPDRFPCRVTAGLVAPGGVVEGRRDPHTAPPSRCRRVRAVGGSYRLTWPDRALLALLAGTLPTDRLAGMRLIVIPGNILRWHRDIVRRRWSRRSRQGRPGRPATHRKVRSVVLRLARENESWGLPPHPRRAGRGPS